MAGGKWLGVDRHLAPPSKGTIEALAGVEPASAFFVITLKKY